MNGFLEGKNIYSTVCDDRAAMHKAASHLIRSGRKRILYLYTSVSYSGNNKLQGYKDALLGVGFIPDPAYIRQCPRDILAAKELLLLLWQEGLKFDAVLTSSDALAAGAVKFALEAKLKIPQEISIIGYNNSILSHCTTPELTSVDSKVEALCTTTVNTLMGVFSGGNVPSRTTLAADLIKRETTDF